MKESKGEGLWRMHFRTASSVGSKPAAEEGSELGAEAVFGARVCGWGCYGHREAPVLREAGRVGRADVAEQTALRRVELAGEQSECGLGDGDDVADGLTNDNHNSLLTTIGIPPAARTAHRPWRPKCRVCRSFGSSGAESLR